MNKLPLSYIMKWFACEIKTKKNKSARLSSSPVTNDSVIENTIPPDYQSIFKRLFSNEIDFNNEL